MSSAAHGERVPALWYPSGIDDSLIGKNVDADVVLRKSYASIAAARPEAIAGPISSGTTLRKDDHAALGAAPNFRAEFCV